MMLISDVRQALRFYRREPLLAGAMLVTLTLAIGLTTAIFAVLDSVVIRPLPYPDPERLVVAWQHDRSDGSWFTVSPANFLDWQAQTGVFDSLAAIQQFEDVEFSLGTAGAPAAITGIHVSPELFRVLGVAPALGRAFTARDAEPGRDRVVILGHDVWTARFGSDRSIVGRDIRLNGAPFTVIGVMPAGFELPIVAAQVYLPVAWTPEQRRERRIANYLVVGRLNDQVTLAQASADLDGLARALERQYPATNRDTGILLDPLREQVIGTVRPSLVAMFAAAVGVLLLASFNLANLAAARAIAHQRELSLRAALGASRWRLLRATIIEALLTSCLGGGAGLVCGTCAVRGFVALFNETRYFSLPRRAEIAFDWRVFAFAAAACVATSLLVGAVPAARAMRADLVAMLKRIGDRRDSRLRGLLLAGELAFSLMLVVVCLLLLRSYVKLHGESAGFDAGNVLTAKIALPADRYRTPAARAAFFGDLLAQAAALPGVSGAASVQLLPLNGVGSVWSIALPDRPGEQLPPPFHFTVSPGYFEMLRIPVIAGRTFDAQDVAGRRRVAIVSAAAAARYFPGQNPIGRAIRIEDREHAVWDIVGVVGDVRSQRLDRAPRPQVYVPMAQSPSAAMTIVMRSRTRDPIDLSRPLQDLVHRLDDQQAVADVKTMIQVVDDSSARWRVSTFLFVGFAAVAIVLAVTGLFSATSFTVAQRTREIAIRLALGDTHGGIVALIVRSLTAVIGGGIAAGLVLALALGRTVSTLVYGIDVVDPLSYASAAVGFALIVLVTGAASASRASAVEAAIALRAE